MNNKRHSNFDREFKHTIARETLAKRLPKQTAASNIGVTTGTVNRWVREYKEANNLEIDTTFSENKCVELIERAAILIEKQADQLIFCRSLLNSNLDANEANQMKCIAALRRLLQTFEEGVEPASDLIHELHNIEKRYLETLCSVT